MSTRKVTGLPLPETPREAPPEFHGLVDAIEDRLAESDALGGVSALACSFEYLTRYFAAVAGCVAQMLELTADSEVAEDFEAARVQLKDRLLVLGEKSTDDLSKLVRSVFFVGATRQSPTPRRHARLLDLGGIPIRGYLNLGEWIALEPGGPELTNDSKANRELLRYLPILKEWVTAASPYFLDVRQGPLSKASDNSVSFEISLGGHTRVAGPVTVSAQTMAVLQEHLSTSGAAPAAPPTEPAEAPTPSAQAASPTPDDSEGLSTAEFPIPEAVARAIPSFSEPPKIEVMGVEPKPSAAPEGAELSSSEQAAPEGPSPDSPRAVSAEPPRQADSLGGGSAPSQQEQPAAASVLEQEQARAPETAVSEAVKSPDVPDSLALPDPEKRPEDESGKAEDAPRAGLAAPEAVASPAQNVTERLSVEGLQNLEAPEPVTEASGSEEDDDFEDDDLEDDDEDLDEDKWDKFDDDLDDDHKTVFQTPLPPVEEFSDPVIAALHTPKPEKQKTKEPPPVLELYPVVTGPPPEFFDEIEVESDYPELLTTALNDLNGAIESNDSRIICGQLQRCFDIMIQFFAGLVGAILSEIDADALFDFDLEDGRFDLELKIDLIVTGLSALEEHWEGHDTANLLWSVFYDTLLPATDPNCAYLHTRLLGVEGLVPDPFLEFSELCQIVPGQDALATQEDCREMAHRYLPILSFWLENAMPLFLECEIDFVEEDDGAAQSWAATLAGATLDGTPSGLWLEVSPERWNLPRPELAPVFVSGDAPDVLLPVFDEINTALEKADFSQAGLYSRVALDFLVQYFAGCAASLWRQQGAMTDQALKLFYPEASLAEKERLLLLSLGGISTESEVGSNLNKLFSKSSLQYRSLAQRGQPSSMIAISEWAAKRDEVSEAELLIYLPLLRSWIGAANPWFSSGEQLFEEPSEDGVLEGVVACGDDFLEMVDPEYVIQLARECLELVAPFDEADEEDEIDTPADSPFTGKLPQLPILTVGPPVLVGHVGRLLESANDRRTSNAWLGSSFEYLIQYYAGLCTTVLGGKSAPINRQALEYFSPTASLRQREILLVECIEHLKKAATGDVQESLRDVFLKPDGSYRQHTKYLGVLGAGSLNEHEMLLSFWCRARHQAGHLTTEELHFGTAVLNSWLEASKPFFSSCEHYAEDPGADGQEEMVVELADDYLDMVLPDYAIQIPARGYYELLYKESDSEAVADVSTFFPEDVRPDLLAPQDVVLGGAADLGGDELLGAAVELGGQDMFPGAGDSYDSDDLFAGSSAATTKLDTDALFAPVAAPEEKKPKKNKFEEMVKEAKAARAKAEGLEPEGEAEGGEPEKRKKKKKRSRKQELGNAVLELYKKERLEKARKRAEARARKAESTPSVLKYTMQYRGLKNSKQLGSRGHFGIIELINAGGGELKGTIEPSHPCVKVQPNRFEGNQVRVIYQVDPSDMPSTGRAGLAINTQDERVVLRLDQLVPTSWWSERTTSQALGLMAGVVASHFMTLLFLLLIFGGYFEASFARFAPATAAASLPFSIHIRAWILVVFFMILPVGALIPALQKWFYSKFDYTVQEETKWALVPSMIAPSALLTLLMYGTKFWSFKVPPERLPFLANRLVVTGISVGLGILATSLFYLQTTTWWEENQESGKAKKATYGFWILTLVIGVLLTLFVR